jgi:hypothetical protein
MRSRKALRYFQQEVDTIMDFNPRDYDSRNDERSGLDRDRDIGTVLITIATGTTGGNPRSRGASATMTRANLVAALGDDSRQAGSDKPVYSPA